MRYITPTNATSLADEVEKRVRSLVPFSLKHEFNSFAHQVCFGNLSLPRQFCQLAILLISKYYLQSGYLYLSTLPRASLIATQPHLQ
jgi:hypothetical protein